MKQRLVGALVLLSGGVVLWSVLFTGPAAYKVDRRTQIPPAPDIAPVPEVAPQMPEGIAPVETPLLPADDGRNEPEPEVADAATPPVQIADKTKPEPESKPEPKPAPVARESQAPAKPALTADSNLPVAWEVQVASFGQKANADKLKDKLQAQGYKAYVKRVSRAKGDIYRVLVGPKVSQADALQDKRAIEKHFDLKTLLVRFER